MSNGQLKAFVERVEKLEEDKRQISAEMSYVYAEAKANEALTSDPACAPARRCRNARCNSNPGNPVRPR